MSLFDDFSNCIGDFGRIFKGEQPLYLKNHRAEDKRSGTLSASIGSSNNSSDKKRREQEELEEEEQRERDLQAIEDAAILMAVSEAVRRR